MLSDFMKAMPIPKGMLVFIFSRQMIDRLLLEVSILHMIPEERYTTEAVIKNQEEALRTGMGTEGTPPLIATRAPPSTHSPFLGIYRAVMLGYRQNTMTRRRDDLHLFEGQRITVSTLV